MMTHETAASFFINNRQRLCGLLRPGSIAVLNSNDVMPTNADGTFKFRQNNDLFYLTGIGQEETILLLFPGHPDVSCREILFISRPDPLREKWDGKMYTKATASEVSGVGHIKYTDEFETVFHALVLKAAYIYLNAVEHTRARISIRTKDDRFAAWCRRKYQLHQYARLAPLMMQLRMIKSETEIALLKRSAAITEKGFRRLLKFVRPGITEKQVEAEMIHEYLFNGGDWAGYAPIVASGAASCILHSIANDQVCKDGDVVLIDAAASYCGYHSDLTRVLPVNGKFAVRQKQVYNAVLNIHRTMKALMKPGALMKELQGQCNELIVQELVGLGLCTMDELRRNGNAGYLDRYAYHGFSHFIGLDVHDVGDFDQPLAAGMVLTVEPGIYIAEERTGIRLENNILITSSGSEDLMAGIPIDADEIEQLMNERLIRA